LIQNSELEVVISNPLN